MIQYTEKEIEYQLEWEWDVSKTVFGEDSNGNFHYGSTNITDKRRNVKIVRAEQPTEARINFDPDLCASNLRVLLLEVDDKVDHRGVKAFSMEHVNVKEYFPSHTRYEGEDNNGNHLVEFVVREEDMRFHLSKGDKVTLNYTLHPDSDKDDKLYVYFLTKRIGNS